MATYTEIAEILGAEGDDLREKVRVATLIRLNEILAETDDGTEPVRRRKRFAQASFRETMRISLKHQPSFERVFRVVVTQNVGATKAQILGATDNQIKNATDTAIAFFVGNFTDPEPAP